MFMHSKIAVFHENRNDWCMFWAMFTFFLSPYKQRRWRLQIFQQKLNRLGFFLDIVKIPPGTKPSGILSFIGRIQRFAFARP